MPGDLRTIFFKYTSYFTVWIQVVSFNLKKRLVGSDTSLPPKSSTCIFFYFSQISSCKLFFHLYLFILAHLIWKLKWAFLVSFCQASVRPSVCLSVCPTVCNFFLHFQLLLQSHSAHFSQTFHKASLCKEVLSLLTCRAKPYFKGK